MSVWSEHLFDCIICRRDIRDYAGRNGRDRHLAPVCNNCERKYSDRRPGAGAFMDRRLVCQISALANALSGEAHAKKWQGKYGYS